VNLLELTAAYCAVAAGAYPIRPWAITGFGAEQHFDSPPPGSGAWRLEAKNDLRTLLESVVRSGSGRRARLPIASYGKTGTSQDHRDGWFIGFAGNLVAGVWVGNDDFSPMKGVTGGQLPAQIWQKFMVKAIQQNRLLESKLPHVANFPAAERQLVSVKLGSDRLSPTTQRSSRAAEFATKRGPRTGSMRARERWAGSNDTTRRRVLPNATGFLRHLFN
jgi:penicillin-binding protein 1A